MTAPVDVAAIGEAMVLLVPEDGSLDEANAVALRMAGAESNVMIGLARLGHRSAYLSAVGDDPFGRIITRTLASEFVDATGILVDSDAPTGVFFKDPTPSGTRRVYYYRQGSAASRLGPEVLAHVDRLDPRVFVVSGLTLGLGGDEGLSGQAREAMRRCHRRGTRVVFDTNVRPGLWDGQLARRQFADLVGHVDVVLSGREEMALLVPDHPAEEAAARLCENGAQAVVVKDGPGGAVVVEPTGSTRVPAVGVDRVVDAVGAGDAFATGIVAGMLRSWPYTEGARLGARLASCVITSLGDWEALPAGEAVPDFLDGLGTMEELRQ